MKMFCVEDKIIELIRKYISIEYCGMEISSDAPLNISADGYELEISIMPSSKEYWLTEEEYYKESLMLLEDLEKEFKYNWVQADIEKRHCTNLYYIIL